MTFLANTWLKNMPYRAKWQERIRALLNLLEDNNYSTIADVGCGNMQAKKVIEEFNPQTQYIGMDQYNQTNATENFYQIDFNSDDKFPSIIVDICLLSGILEYIFPEYIEKFIGNICKITKRGILLSYHTDQYLERNKVWTNSLNDLYLNTLFNNFNFSAKKETKVFDGQNLYLFERIL